MNHAATRLIAVAHAIYGVYIASYVPAMLVGPSSPVLLIAFVVQSVCAFVAAIGVWRRAPWAPGAVVFLGLSVACTWIVEGFILGIVAYLHALLVAVIAVVAAFVIANYLDHDRHAIAG